MNIKVLNDEQNVVEMCVIGDNYINTPLILNVDLNINENYSNKFDLIKSAFEYVKNENIVENFNKEVIKGAKRNKTTIKTTNYFKEHRKEVFKLIKDIENFDEKNLAIEQYNIEQMALENIDVFINSYLWWQLNKEYQLEQLKSNFKTLEVAYNTFKKVYGDK